MSIKKLRDFILSSPIEMKKILKKFFLSDKIVVILRPNKTPIEIRMIPSLQTFGLIFLIIFMCQFALTEYREYRMLERWLSAKKEIYICKDTVQTKNNQLVSAQEYLEYVAEYIKANKIDDSVIASVHSDRQKKTTLKIQEMDDVIRKVEIQIKNKIDRIHKIFHASGIRDTQIGKFGKGGPFVKNTAETMVANRYNINYLIELENTLDNIPKGSPLKDYKIVSHFGVRSDPFFDIAAFHPGIDIVSLEDQHDRIVATQDGVVVHASNINNGYGIYVDIKHNNNLVTRYAHLSKANVKLGDFVKKGDVIGEQGATGRAQGPHLHYEIIYNNKAINPYHFIKNNYEAF